MTTTGQDYVTLDWVTALQRKALSDKSEMAGNLHYP